MVYRFEKFELDLLARALRVDGEIVAVEPKVLDLLHLLIRHRRFVIRRDVLLSEIWPEIAVSEASLSRLVKEARRTVGDNGNDQRLIRTVRGTGYQFVGRVETPAPSSEESQFDDANERIAHARITLESAAERGARDLRVHIEEFIQSCQLVLDSIRTDGSQA